jgi:hypothetical protein
MRPLWETRKMTKPLVLIGGKNDGLEVGIEYLADNWEGRPVIIRRNPGGGITVGWAPVVVGCQSCAHMGRKWGNRLRVAVLVGFAAGMLLGALQ